MKTQSMIILLLLINSFAFSQKDIDNFRGHKWDTPFSSMSAGLKPTSSKTPGYKGYEKASENYVFEGITSYSIIYLFKSEKFVGVTIGIKKSDVDKALATLKKKYGEPRVTDTPFLKNYEWYLDKSVIVLSYFPTNQSEESASIGIRKPK